MTKTDWFQLALNAFVAFITFVGAVESPGDEGLVVFAMATTAVVVNSLILVRRAGARTASRPARSPDPVAAPTELDAYRVLDIDQRLEALERAESNRIEMLVREGLLTAPADDARPPAVSRPRERA